MFFDPWLTKESLKHFLSRLKEDQELDAWIKIFVSDILRHKIVMSPSKGPYGEKGKDIVAIENESTGEYCSYVVKRGTLQDNLYGPYGILKQMRDAMMIDLEIFKYKRKKRTVVVVHNGDEGYRGAINKFETEKTSIESEINGNLLLRPIERWDIGEITDRIFPHQQYLKNSELCRMLLNSLHDYQDIAVDFHKRAKTILLKSEMKTEQIEQLFMEHYDKIDNIRRNYSFYQITKQGKSNEK